MNNEEYKIWSKNYRISIIHVVEFEFETFSLYKFVFCYCSSVLQRVLQELFKWYLNCKDFSSKNQQQLITKQYSYFPFFLIKGIN